MRRVLVTGGAGFIGKHLCRKLLEDPNNYVICLDNNSTSKPWDVRNDPDLIASGRIELVYHDVCEPWHIDADQIYHCACPASPIAYKNNPVRTIETAVLGTRNALKLARDVGARLLICSTSEVYGDPLVNPQPETYYGNVNPIGPRCMYDEGKRCGEALAASWAQQYGTVVRIARLFNVFGPGMVEDDGRLIPTIIKSIKQKQPIPIYGDGSQTRSWCYVSDTVDGLIKLMNSDNPNLGNPAVINIGNPYEVTIKRIAEMIMRMLKSQSKIEYLPMTQDDPKVRCPDISKAQELLDWWPKVNLSEGLQKTLGVEEAW